MEEESARATAEDDERYKTQCEELYQINFKLTELSGQHDQVIHSQDLELWGWLTHPPPPQLTPHLCQVSASYAELQTAHALSTSRVGELTTQEEELKRRVAEKEETEKSFAREIVELKERTLQLNATVEERGESISSLEQQLEVSSGCVRDLNSRCGEISFT